MAVGVGLACAATVGAALAIATLWGVGAGLAAGATVAALTSAVGAVAGDRFTAQLRVLNAAAIRRLQQPGLGDEGRGRTSPLAGNELADLARTLDALALRARVADEVAERHRRTADTASAGMFELLSGLVAAEEGARGQLAAELHDTVAQSLALARVEMNLVDPKTLPAGAVEAQALARAADYVDDAEEQVRAVMARTRPPALRDGDLAEAVAALRDELDKRYGLVVELSWPAEPYPVPLATAITVYRFFQEGLLNVVKHADVDVAHARLEMTEDAVVATVHDEGPGFDPSEVVPVKGRHVGLDLLRERARLAGGTVEVESLPASGTTLQLRLPRPRPVDMPAAGPAALPVRLDQLSRGA
jgi:signal transduction histidine kinase